MEVIYRNKTAPPTEPGYYYVSGLISTVEVVPRQVIEHCGNLVVKDEDGAWSSFDYLSFFGPVPTCKEG